MDLYKILEVRKNSSLKTIKKAYHQKALQYHPDKNKNVDIKKFHEIQTAYDILSIIGIDVSWNKRNFNYIRLVL